MLSAQSFLRPHLVRRQSARLHRILPEYSRSRFFALELAASLDLERRIAANFHNDAVKIRDENVTIKTASARARLERFVPGRGVPPFACSFGSRICSESSRVRAERSRIDAESFFGGAE
jgi:hypothetical protein